LGGLASPRRNINIIAEHEGCRQIADLRRSTGFVSPVKQRVLRPHCLLEAAGSTFRRPEQQADSIASLDHMHAMAA
jgi:hypothetical protein